MSASRPTSPFSGGHRGRADRRWGRLEDQAGQAARRVDADRASSGMLSVRGSMGRVLADRVPGRPDQAELYEAVGQRPVVPLGGDPAAGDLEYDTPVMSGGRPVGGRG